MKRRGFALLSAILIAAFMLAVVTGIGATLASQLRSQARAGLSKRALYYAEAALQESFVAACNPNDPPGGIRETLAPTKSQTTPSAWNGHGDLTVVARVCSVSGDVPDVRSFTWVKAKPVFASDNKTLLRYEFIAEGVVCDRKVTGRNASELEAGTAFGILARRVVKLDSGGLSANFGPAFNYALFAGNGIIQNGNSTYTTTDPSGVSVYAGADVSMNTSQFGSGIDVYAHGTVDIKSGSGYPHADPLVMPPIDLAHWQSQFVAFLNGTAPYDGTIPSGGTVPLHMNTNDPTVRTVIGTYLNLTGHPVSYTTPVEVAGLIAALKPKWEDRTGAMLLIIDPNMYLQLQTTVSNTVFYVQDSAGSPDATIPDLPFSGVLVCPGALTFEQKSVVDSTDAVFMSKGNLTFNGSGVFQGTFFTEGTFLHNGSTSQLHGSVIALQGDIVLNGASTDTVLVNYAAGKTWLEDQFQVQKAIKSGWSEADYGAFTGFLD